VTPTDEIIQRYLTDWGLAFTHEAATLLEMNETKIDEDDRAVLFNTFQKSIKEKLLGFIKLSGEHLYHEDKSASPAS